MPFMSVEDRPAGIAPILAHLHIFKNSGSTLDWILRRNFGDTFAELHGPDQNSTLRSSDLESFLAANANINVVSSHHVRLPLDAHQARSIMPILFLRHPVDRIASMYEHDRRQNGVDPADPKFHSLRLWVADAIERTSFNVCDMQTMFLAASGTYYSAPTIVECYEALEVLAELPFCGVVDEFEASMVVLESKIRPWMPQFDAAYFPQNVSRGRAAVLPHRLSLMERELGRETYNRLLMENQYDLRLYEAGKAKLKAALESIPDWEMRIAELRSRNEVLA